MDFNTTIEIILKDLREVREIIDDFRNYPDVPLLQVELAKAKCRSAEEVIALLKLTKPGSSTESVQSPKPVRSDQQKSSDTLIEISDEDIEAEKADTQSHAEPAEIRKGTETVSAATPAAGEESSVDGKKSAESGKSDISRKPPRPEKQIFADQFNGIQQTLLDQFGTETGDSTSHLLKDRKITRLSDAIGVNDRFLYIRELFGGDRQAYEDTIARLEGVSSVEEALNILTGFAPEGDYNEYVSQILDIIKRKLPANG